MESLKNTLDLSQDKLNLRLVKKMKTIYRIYIITKSVGDYGGDIASHLNLY